MENQDNVAGSEGNGEDEFADCEEIPSPDQKNDDQIMESPGTNAGTESKFF